STMINEMNELIKKILKKAAKDLKNRTVFSKSFAAFFNLSANFPEDISLLLFLYVFYHMNCCGGMSGIA
ncbi:hypothetical protein, partial [Bacteroides sp.]|uniref:hypothetical protein n=1 Tax=Bacteroides sp. TaxID=29523 RepID=UPI0025873FB5